MLDGGKRIDIGDLIVCRQVDTGRSQEVETWEVVERLRRHVGN